MDRIYKIFVINPGSTSTKLSLFYGNDEQFTTDVFHDSSELLKFPTINDQLDYRMRVVSEFLEKNSIDISDIDAIVGRGGSCRPVESGVYAIDDRMIDDTRKCVGGLYHSSMLGVQMAGEMKKLVLSAKGLCTDTTAPFLSVCELNAISDKPLLLMMDPPIMDELSELARVSGVKGINRRAVSHALNLKATARRHAAEVGRKYEEMNLIVCHIDGGISITAHEHGRMVDGNDAGGGEGPFTPTRMGSMAVTDVIDYFLTSAYASEENRKMDEKLSSGEIAAELRKLCSQAGGLSSHFGTSSSDRIHALVEAGDRQAGLVWNAMIYQICKWIGAMAPVLKGRVDGIVLAGGLLRFDDLVDQIRDRCEWIAPVYCYPGEFEQVAMAEGGLRILKGEEKLYSY